MLAFVAACGDDEGAQPGPGVPNTGTIAGTVRDEAGNPIVGATVGTSPATEIALTDAQGGFRIENVEVGSYAVVASKEGFNSDVETVTVAEGQTANVSLTLTGDGAGGDTTGNVTGLVLRRAGQPVPEGTTVEIFRDASSCADTTAVPDESATTDAGGRFVIEDLAPGNYLACVTATIGGVEFTGRTAFVVNAGEITQADITVGRDADQTTEPNVGGEFIELDANGNFNGIIRFVDIDGDGDDEVDCNLIQTQHLWVVEVFHDLDNDGVVDVTTAGVPTEPLVSGVRVEWSLNQGGTFFNPVVNGEFFVQGTTGVIVDTDDPFLDPVQAESAKTAGNNAAPQFKVDDTHAITYTNDSDQVIDFGGGVVTIGEGRTWIIVTSPNEGFTDVVAFSPDLSRATFPEGDKAFAVKRWVNWRIEVAELTPSDVEDFLADTLDADLVSDGGVLIDRLDRTPVFGLSGPDSCNDAFAPQGSVCDLSNRAFIGIAITQFRTDRPMTFLVGEVEFTTTDSIPDVEIEDIDSDSLPGGPGFSGGGTISANGNFAEADFSLNTPVSFQCEPNPGDPSECLDVDVVVPGPNTAGQDLSDIGFTVTTGAELLQGAVSVTVALDSTRFFAFVDTLSPTGFSFNEDLQRLINSQGDNENEFTIDVLDEFGEVCDQIVITKQWITSILRIFKQGPTTVGLDDVFEYTVTVVNDGDDLSTNVVIADTLPLLNEFPNPGGTVADTTRDGHQAFRYVTDDPTFDPDGIRYYIDTDDNEFGTDSDVCFEAPVPGFPSLAAFPRDPDRCPVFLTFPTIAAARTAAQTVSTGGTGATPLTGNTTADQVVIVEYFDEDVLSRTGPGGPIEAEDSFEITLEAIQSVNEFRLASGAIPTRTQRNGQWCNIATVTSAENDFAADSVCTRVIEALLEVRKTADDAIVVAGDQAEFLIEIANNGSDDLVNVTVSDTLDVLFTVPADTVSNPGLVMIDSTGTVSFPGASDCTGCTFVIDTIASGATTITVTVPLVPPTDDAVSQAGEPVGNNNGVFDDNEGFRVATLVTRTPLRQGTFCNRVTVSTDEGLEDTDIACVVTQVEIEFDIVNTDGLRDAAGVFQDVETFQVGDSIQYVTNITNRSNVAATNVQVLWEIAPEFRIIEFVRILNEDPAAISCSAASDTCSVTVASLAPGGVIALDYLTIANFSGNDVNRITLTANELSLPVVNEEPTTVNP